MTRKSRPCPVGKQGIILNGENEAGHVHVCTPELRALVRGAIWEYQLARHHHACICKFCRGVRPLQRSREGKP
jgi:hypothetical protein